MDDRPVNGKIINRYEIIFITFTVMSPGQGIGNPGIYLFRE
jgi:hypothetical protein